ncbi:MAG: family 20 glycosylhydrolase [Vicinamibacterales bacterium]|nr:family 20 glycosylhydrolase [Vicinamibacterales bacterium]
MRHRIALALVIMACSVLQVQAQTALQLQWELTGDVFADARDRGTSRAVFTLTNHDTRPLPATGWAIYFNALLGRVPGSEQGSVVIEQVAGELYRMVPAPAFPGLAPGRSARFEYTTSLIGNVTQAPVGPYIVFDNAPGKGHAITQYKALPFERPDQQGRAPRVLTPAAAYDRNAAIADLPAASLPLILPTPVSVQMKAGTLRLTGVPTITASAELSPEATFAAAYLAPRFAGVVDNTRTLALHVGAVEGQQSPEAYALSVDTAGIRIVGNSRAGVFYGLQSLRSLLPLGPQGQAGVELPAVHVVDAPRFGYRGLHLDVARNFQPKADVLRVLDLMARYKINVLHFHLTEDEGWRIEIPGLPELTDVGARRGHTLDSADFLPPAYGSGPDVGRPFGSGFYSRADYIEILKYAAARHIEVIPEIEMPGHARAAIKAMEARFRRLSAAGHAEAAGQYLLSDAGDQSVYTSAQLWHDNVMNPAQASTYAFIEKVVDEMVAVHAAAGVPLRNLHMGGDEVPNGVWEKSPVAQAYLKAHSLTSVDDLWFVFYGRVEQILQRHGIVLSGWEEIAVRKTRLDGRSTLIPNPQFAARGWRTYVWNNVPGWGAEDLAYRLANGGYQVVLCPVTNLYLDMAYNMNPEEPGLFWGGFIDLDKPFDFIPFDYYRNTREDARGNPVPAGIFVGKDRLTDYGRANIVGLQACLWSETLREDGRLDYMLMPKLLGLAERAWAPDPDWARESDAGKAASLHQEAWSRFVNTVGTRELPRLDREGWNINYRIPTPGLKVVDGAVRSNLQIPGFTLRYTTDGSEPTAASPVVEGPITARGLIRVAAFDGRGRKGATAKTENRLP